MNETLFSQIQKLFERTYAQVGINLEECIIDRTRCAQLSLRRLGESPSALPCTTFRLHRAQGLGPPVELSPIPGSRAQWVDQLREGMSPREVLDMIDAPDWIGYRRPRAWEFDIDANPSYTLLVFWEAKPYRVVKIERVAPAWRDGETRDEALER